MRKTKPEYLKKVPKTTLIHPEILEAIIASNSTPNTLINSMLENWFVNQVLRAAQLGGVVIKSKKADGKEHLRAARWIYWLEEIGPFKRTDTCDLIVGVRFKHSSEKKYLVMRGGGADFDALSQVLYDYEVDESWAYCYGADIERVVIAGQEREWLGGCKADYIQWLWNASKRLEAGETMHNILGFH